MSFINKYNKVNPYGYGDSIKIGNFIYAVGSINNENYKKRGLITKLDLNGNVIWEKFYESNDGKSMFFSTIIKCENDNLLISGIKSINTGYDIDFIIRLDSGGNVIWEKSYKPEQINATSSSISNTILKLNGDNYLIHISDSYMDNSSYTPIGRHHNHLVKIDGSGTIINKKSTTFIKGTTFEFTQFKAATNGSEIVLAGSGENKIIFIAFDNNLNQTNKFGLTPPASSGIYEIQLSNIYFHLGKLILTGYFRVPNVTQNRGFINEINFPVVQEPSTGSIPVKSFDGQGLSYYFLNFNNDFYYISYLQTTSPIQKTIIKLDLNFNQIWFKTIEVPANTTYVSEVYQDSILLVGSNYLAMLNTDLDSCKTTNGNLLSTINYSLDFNSLFSVTYADINVNISVFDFSTSLITSVKEEICPTVAIVTPTFNEIDPICSGTILNPLPITSNNGIQGTWSPSINNTATTTYTFTPNAGQSATTATMTIVVNPKITPTFNQIAPINSGDILSPIPATSLEGITGIWTPKLNNTQTTVYTFTPTFGLCASSTTITIIVNPVANPCIKDEKICALYSQLLEIQQKCLKEPEGKIKIESFIDCFKKGLDIIFNFIKSFAKEEWIKFLEQYITIIKIYVENPTLENYTNAYQAYDFILNFISQLGNCNCENSFQITDFASIQSGQLYLQSAGSQGEDSTKGIHLRWTFRDKLASHLPKANYATTNFNFNKPNDFVKIFRAPYKENKIAIDFTTAPSLINDSIAFADKHWIYTVNTNYIFHIYFRNTVKYNQVRATIDPSIDPSYFIKNYGNSLIEVENKTQLSFAVTPNFIENNSPSTVKLELLSVAENKITAPKTTTLRKEYKVVDLNNQKLISENIRSIRFLPTNAILQKLEFELYSDFIKRTTKDRKWSYVSKLALTKNTYTAYNRLEPQNHCLDNWSHFNEEAYVNTDNYKSRWNGNVIDPIKNMNYVVDKYIHLSDTISNPLATETILLNASPEVQSCMVSNPMYQPNPNNSFNVSYLNLLQMASLDYHNARMLGLGVLDLNSSLFDGSYIYMAEYYTLVDLIDGVSSHKIQHLYCSLPTSIADERLPDAVAIDYIKSGVNNVDGSDTYELTDIDGYTKDNKSRYLSLFNKPVHKEIQNSAFYYTNYEFISSQKTNPVFVGLEYKKTSDAEWRKPELSHDLKYFDSNGVPETKVILIPPVNRPFYIHREKQSGEHQYCSYGINWFSRSTNSDLPIPILTALRPANELLPPSNVNALLIKKESPLALTSANEQVMFTTIPETEDRTLIRLTFDYNHAQELISYHFKINGNIVQNYYELANQKEAFGDDIQVFFKNQIPSIVTGKIKQVFSAGNPVSIEVTTDVFPVLSSGINTNVPATNPPTYNEMYTPSIPIGQESNYIGSIMLVNGIEFVIQSIDNTAQYPKFTLFKADPNGEEVTLETVLDSTHVLLSPTVNSMFTIVENIQNSSFWTSPNPFPFTVNNVITNTITIDQTTVYREEINVTNPDCNVDTHVQKFRGIYEDAIIEKIEEKIDENHDGIYDLIDPSDPMSNFVLKHQGIYRITFPNFYLHQHSQYQQTDFSVEFSTGIVRLHTFNDPDGPRKEFKVIKVENIGVPGMDLVLYVCDLTFPTNLSLVSSYVGRIMADNASQISQKVNYYPSYKVYFSNKPSFGFTEANLLPIDEEDFKYSVFALRSHDYPGEVIEDGFVIDNLIDYYSKMSQPAFMFAQANIAPQQPEKPLGGLYATRPDFFGKSTYTFKTEFKHKPYSVQFNRATDIQILSALYENNRLYDTNNVQTNYNNNVKDIMENIFKNGAEPFYVNLWEDLLDFRPTNSNTTLQTFTETDGSTVHLPFPNNPKFIEGINAFIDAHNDYYHNLPGVVPHLNMTTLNLMTEVIPLVNNADGTVRNEQLKFRDFIRDVVFNCFVPLTEIPIIYNLIKGQASYFPNYKPIPKKQVVRDRNGDLLPQDHPDFDMAPMMRVVGTNQTQFTDFGLDGASNAKYFYAVREFNSQMQTSPYSTIQGPINLVNSAPAIAPEIIKVIPVLENRTLGIAPCIQLQINSYNKTQNIKKINIYRATNANDSLSIRTMKLAKVIDFDIDNLQDDSQWIFTDDFADLGVVPFGDPLYYRITVSRKIKYTDKFFDDQAPSTVDQTIVDYAPSEASKFVLTNIVENYSPESPILNYTAGAYNPASDVALDYITLNWQQNMYKGNYHLYKMNAQGNWVEIIRVISDRLTAGVYHFYNQNTQGEWVNTDHPEPLVTFNNMIYLPLEVTNLATTSLATKTVDGKPIYHHLKVLSENTAGMYSKKENILTLYNAASYRSDDGISSDGTDGMIVQGNFIVRHN